MSEFTIGGSVYDAATHSFPRVPALCVLMRTKHYGDGHKRTEPVGVAPDPEAAAAWIAKMVRAWSTDATVVQEECPAYYFVPVPKETP